MKDANDDGTTGEGEHVLNETRKMSHYGLSESKNLSHADLPCVRHGMRNLASLQWHRRDFPRAQAGRWACANFVRVHVWVVRSDLAQKHCASSGSNRCSRGSKQLTWRQCNLHEIEAHGFVATAMHKACGGNVQTYHKEAVRCVRTQ